MKSFLFVGVVSFVFLTLAAVAQVPPMPGAPGNAHEVAAEALLKPFSKRQDYVNFMRFQAEERKAFYADLSAEKGRLQAQAKQSQVDLLAQQRAKRNDFDPEKFSIDQRREFFVSQRDEMVALKAKNKQEERDFKQIARAKANGFQNRQKKDRIEFALKLRSEVRKKE